MNLSQFISLQTNLSCSCDEINLDGSKKPSTQERSTFGHAQKMRAAMTYAFGRVHGLGNMQWHEDAITRRMVGNPSVSDTVSLYMLSLRRRKVSSIYIIFR